MGAVQRILGYGRVARNQRIAQEAKASLPVPWPERIVIRFEVGREASASACWDEGVTPIASVANRSGESCQDLSLSRMKEFKGSEAPLLRQLLRHHH